MVNNIHSIFFFILISTILLKKWQMVNGKW